MILKKFYRSKTIFTTFYLSNNIYSINGREDLMLTIWMFEIAKTSNHTKMKKIKIKLVNISTTTKLI